MLEQTGTKKYFESLQQERVRPRKVKTKSPAAAQEPLEPSTAERSG
jgi:hypothetical protein